MTDTDRLIFVGTAALVVAVVAVGARWLRTHRSRRIGRSGLEPGVYLLSSADCATCHAARSKLERRGVRFAELTWQGQPEVFRDLSVEEVPSVLLVAPDGSARWWRGAGPMRTLARSGDAGNGAPGRVG